VGTIRVVAGAPPARTWFLFFLRSARDPGCPFLVALFSDRVGLEHVTLRYGLLTLPSHSKAQASLARIHQHVIPMQHFAIEIFIASGSWISF